jgi:hypothetical protein
MRRRSASISWFGIHTSRRNPLAWNLASTLASTLFVLTLAQAIARTWGARMVLAMASLLSLLPLRA